MNLLDINENALARAITGFEGGKVNLTIAQVKEVMRITLHLLSQERPSRVLMLVEKHAKLRN